MRKHSTLLNLKRSLISALVICVLSACQKETNDTDVNTEETKPTQESVVTNDNAKMGLASAKAIALSKKYLITDTHIDVPYRLEDKYEDISVATESGDFDYPRAVAGGLDAPFMSIYIPAELEQKGGSKELADKLIDMIEVIVEKSPKKYALAYTTEQMQKNFSEGKISLPLGMENGSPIEGKLENLTHFYKRGIRYITLTHSKANHISDSSYDENRPAKGLTDFGKKLVIEMNNIGIMVDVSHISDDSFFQVMEISKAPVIASHSSARHFTPGFERNMSDDMIKLLAEKGGVIQINFGSTFIAQKSIENYNAFKTARSAYMKINSVEQASDEVKEFTKNYRAKLPFEYATTSDVLDHFDHVVKLTSIDHVGIGSDYDGVGDSLPIGLKDVSSYPNLIQGLLDRGYSDSDIEKVLSGNLIRVWKQVEVYAASKPK
ncbi:MAG: peptidase M19 [Kangiella sp.]|nr:MAG: peptidase M19 [Kangiella sp.]PHS19906.1 MAG: peptidase M19 [Kangiella sp.]